jgi:predicted DsbA family dithiol-disulfide isomerase
MKIEIWSDVVCPFCYIGKRNLETALAQFPNKDQVQIEWKSFQLDPTTPEQVSESYAAYVAQKRKVTEAQGRDMLAQVTESAKQVGLHYQLDKAIIANSRKAHLLLQLAKLKGKGPEMEERLFKAFFTEGALISDTDTLTRLGEELGFSASEIADAFQNDLYAYHLATDLQEAQLIGVTGVPFFVFDRKYAISGAQPPQAFLDLLHRSYQEWQSASS